MSASHALMQQWQKAQQERVKSLSGGTRTGGGSALSGLAGPPAPSLNLFPQPQQAGSPWAGMVPQLNAGAPNTSRFAQATANVGLAGAAGAQANQGGLSRIMSLLTQARQSQRPNPIGQLTDHP